MLDSFTFHQIKQIAGLAGLDVTRSSHLEQRHGGGASKGQLITALDGEVAKLDQTRKSQVLSRIAEEILSRRSEEGEWLDTYLRRLGWQFVDSRPILVELS